MARNFSRLVSLSTSAGCDIPGSLSEEISMSVLGRFENIIDFSHISLCPLSVPHVTELRGVTIPYQFHVVMNGWHLLVLPSWKTIQRSSSHLFPEQGHSYLNYNKGNHGGRGEICFLLLNETMLSTSFQT